MSKKNEVSQFDLRIIERKLHSGEIKKSDYEKFLKSLPDDSKEGVFVHPIDLDNPMAVTEEETVS